MRCLLAGCVALVAGLVLLPSGGRARSYPYELMLPLTERIDRADLVLLARDRFALNAAQSGRGARVVGITVERVLAGDARWLPEADSTGERTLRFTRPDRGSVAWTVTGGRSLYFLNRVPPGWVVRFGMGPFAEPRTIAEVNDALDSLASAVRPARNAGRAAAIRWLEGVRDRLPPDRRGARFIHVRAVPDPPAAAGPHRAR